MAAPGAEPRLQQLHTYAWLPDPANRPSREPFLREDVMQAADRKLASKGFQRVDASAHPDFLLGWHTTTQEKTKMEDVNAFYGYPWGPYGGALGPAQVAVPYTQGSLILDVVDPASKQLLWRGDAQADLGSNPSPADSAKKIDEAAGKILERFPPKTS